LGSKTIPPKKGAWAFATLFPAIDRLVAGMQTGFLDGPIAQRYFRLQNFVLMQ